MPDGLNENDTFVRNFRLVLKAGSPVLAPGFQAFAVDKHGKHEHIFVNPNDFFLGHLQGLFSLVLEDVCSRRVLYWVTFPNIVV